MTTLYNQIKVYLVKPINGDDYVSFASPQQVGKFTELNGMMYFNDITGKIYVFSPANILMVTSEAVESIEIKEELSTEPVAKKKIKIKNDLTSSRPNKEREYPDDIDDGHAYSWR
jgi:hypothetical protein